MNKFKLFDKIKGFRCHVNILELVFMFGIDETLTTSEEINAEIAESGYYIE